MSRTNDIFYVFHSCVKVDGKITIFIGVTMFISLKIVKITNDNNIFKFV